MGHVCSRGGRWYRCWRVETGSPLFRASSLTWLGCGAVLVCVARRGAVEDGARASGRDGRAVCRKNRGVGRVIEKRCCNCCDSVVLRKSIARCHALAELTAGEGGMRATDTQVNEAERTEPLLWQRLGLSAQNISSAFRSGQRVGRAEVLKPRSAEVSVCAARCDRPGRVGLGKLTALAPRTVATLLKSTVGPAFAQYVSCRAGAPACYFVVVADVV